MRRVVVVLLLLAIVGVAFGPAPTVRASEPRHEDSVGANSAVQYLRVVRRFGAAIRGAPSSNATIYWIASCNDTFVVTGESNGWWQISLGGGDYGWVGGARVSVGVSPAYGNCANAVTFQIGSIAYAHPERCLSLRTYPSRDAPYDYCVPWGHAYEVINGPRTSAQGEDWIQVWSPSTGSGWSLANLLSPWP